MKDIWKKDKTHQLYDPIEDEVNQDWVEKNLKKQKENFLVLSCPFCFE